ncbi:hypothetical protein ABZX30_22875 [Streptomyces sp. NPDC004542]|uniref:hypothetical protein n=1 Tax=Streptomyces sp. NPDC004542 TaxID=3154281 RepID=UPI0033BB8807
MPPQDAASEPGKPGEGELDELRRRVAQLESATVGPAARHRHPLRTTGSVLLVVLASILSILAVTAVWARDQISDTDQFVATMGPLASDPDVQQAVSRRVTDVVVQKIDVPALVDELSKAAAQPGVPPRVSQLVGLLSGPIDDGVKSLIGAAADRVVSSEAFAKAWTDAITLAHNAMVKALTGEGGGAVQLSGDRVTIDLAPVIDQVKKQLVDAGLAPAANIPAVHTQFTVYASPKLRELQLYLRLLQVLGNWLPVVTVLVAAGGVYAACNRRHALIGAALGIAAAMVVLGVALTVFRTYFLNQLPSDVSPGAAGSVYDALVYFLRKAVRAVGVLAVLVALGAFFAGPSRAARTTRAACSTGVGGVRQVAEHAGFRAGPVEPFVRRWKRWIGIVVLVGASIVFVFWDRPTGMVVFWFAVVVLALFGVREFLAPGPGLAALERRTPGPPKPPPPRPGTAPRPGTTG